MNKSTDLTQDGLELFNDDLEDDIQTPIVLEIEARENIALVLNNAIAGSGREASLDALSQYFTSVSKIEWSKIPGCNFSPHLKIQTLNAANEHLRDLQGPYQPNYLCFCACKTGSKVPITFQGSEVISFSYNSVICTPFCGSRITSAEIHSATHPEPIGRIDYVARSFMENEATIQNYVTNEVFNARPILNGVLPGMEVRDSTGKLVAVGGVTFATIRRGVATYRGIRIYFPSIMAPATTKAIMLVFGTLWQMDHQQNNCRYRIIGSLIALLVVIGIVVFAIIHVTG